MTKTEIKEGLKVSRRNQSKKIDIETGTILCECWYDSNKVRVEWDAFSKMGNPIRGYRSSVNIKNLSIV